MNSPLTSKAVIVAQGVEKWYDNNFHVLRGVNLEVKKQEVVVIMGPSGSGKSTFIRTFNALEPYQKGSIEIVEKPFLLPDAQFRYFLNH